MLADENEMELLEAYLDDELPMSEAQELWRRLAGEPELAAALEELRAARGCRLSAWSELEPNDRQAAALAGRIVAAARRHYWRDHVYRGLFYVAAAAACVLFGLRIGWTQRPGGIAAAPVRAMASPAAAMASNAPPSNSAASFISDQHANPAIHDVYPVAIRDQSGRLIGIQRFNTLQEAKDFINELNNSQASAPPSNFGQGVVPASDDQF
jgi:anti-sigma factor RsiW